MADISTSFQIFYWQCHHLAGSLYQSRLTICPTAGILLLTCELLIDCTRYKGHVLTRNCRGGTNLRVGFVELLIGGAGETSNQGTSVNGQGFSSFALKPPRLRRLLEQSWPIGEQLKNMNPDKMTTLELLGQGAIR